MPTKPPPGSTAHRIGLGLAALGRPGYITPGRERDLPPGRDVAAMRKRTHEVLDYAYTHGVRHLDAARSYGRAEEFLAEWLGNGEDRPGLVVSSKWGYTYTADWQVRAENNEVKDHSVDTYDRQLAETRQLLGRHLNIYQVHSVTSGSPALTDPALQRRLAELTTEGVAVGLTTSGPDQRDTIRAALDISVDGEPLFHSVQATWNLLEPSAGPALAEAHEAGLMVIVKEALANGRLVRPDPRLDTLLAPIADGAGTSYDAVALAAALEQPWVDIVLSGVVTTSQLASNLRADEVRLGPGQLPELIADLTESPGAYWSRRAELPWS